MLHHNLKNIWWSHFIFIATIIHFIICQIIFFYFIGGENFSFSIKWILLTSILLTLIPYLSKKTWFAIIWLLIYTIIIHANILYYRYYSTLIPIDSIYNFKINEFFALKGSILRSFRFIDIWLYIPCISLFIIYLCTRKHTYKISILTLVPALTILCIIFLIYIYPNNEKIQKDLSSNFGQFKQTYAYLWFGYPAFVYYSISINNENHELSQQQLKEIKTFISCKNNNNSKQEYNLFDKNIILIIVESLETFTINQKIDGQEITPFLNKLIKDSLTFYAPKVVTQVKDGMSSDAQLIINTGLLPLQNGAACYLSRTYPSISQLLKHKNHFSSCITFIGYTPSIWNQVSMCNYLHYDKLYDIKDFDYNDSFNIGMSDIALFEQSIPIITKLEQPFFIQFITASSHTPFIIPQTCKKINISNKYHPDLIKYIESINYTDNALSILFSRLNEANLLNNSTIILTGDHYAFSNYFRKNILQTSQNISIIDSTDFLPFIVYNGGKSGTYNNILGQVDIFPSLIDIFQLKTKWYGLGQSIFSTSPPQAAVTPALNVVGNSTIDIARLTKAWYISNLVIRGNYFKIIQK